MKKFTTSILVAAFAITPVFALAEETANAASPEATSTVAPRPTLLKERQATLEQKRVELEAERVKRAEELQSKRATQASTTAARKAALEEKRLEKENGLITRAKERAGEEIERRIKNIEQTAERISKMSRLSESDKESLKAMLETEIRSLSELKSGVASATATSTLKDSIKSITKSYRTYALVIPRSNVMAAADRVLAVATQLEQFSTKLAERPATAGSDVATATLTDMNAQLADARTQAAAATALVKDLIPDEGDKAKVQSNQQALKDAHAKIVAAQKSL